MIYTAVIRTLGTAGAKYQQLLDSLQEQTIAPPSHHRLYCRELSPAERDYRHGALRLCQEGYGGATCLAVR